MKDKIDKLFKYRKLPFLLNTLKRKDRVLLNKHLPKIQRSIYDLDAYLESSWKIKEKKLSKFWQEINKTILKVGFDEETVYNMTSHIRKYQLHELQLRENKLPTRLKLDYYYYYKSCDVRLMREIIYAHNPDLDDKIKLSEWRYYDLVTEINDDVEDVFEDQHTINGNCFLISIKENGLEETLKTFDSYLNELVDKSVNRFGKSKRLDKLRIHYYTIKRIEETRSLMHKNAKKVEKKGISKNMILFKYLNA